MAMILLVDDEPEIRIITREMLEKAGHSVVEAGNSAECLKKLKAEKPDLILLNIRMPVDDGWKVCRKIKGDEETKGIPVVMFTVMTSEKDMKYSSGCGADAHINKPFDREELLDTVERILEKTASS
jgi:CheY-like chemotaxis protein